MDRPKLSKYDAQQMVVLVSAREVKRLYEAEAQWLDLSQAIEKMSKAIDRLDIVVKEQASGTRKETDHR